MKATKYVGLKALWICHLNDLAKITKSLGNSLKSQLKRIKPAWLKHILQGLRNVLLLPDYACIH